jgi:hypothetical protein
VTSRQFDPIVVVVVVDVVVDVVEVGSTGTLDVVVVVEASPEEPAGTVNSQVPEAQSAGGVVVTT